jgi:catechol-2,3-dioxygenase
MNDEQRPPIWVGHVDIRTTKLDETEEFFKAVGLRPCFRGDEVAVLEFRGGTHVVVIKDEAAEPADAAFDLMVEDLDDTYAQFKSLNLEVSEVSKGNIHNSFYVTEPGGNRILVNSTHVADHNLV